jgi:Protein of unknown function (DUF2800)
MIADERKGLPAASPWHSYELCAGKYQLEQEAARIGQSAHVTSPEAESGTRIHARLAGGLVELTEPEATTAAFLKERGDWQVERIFQGQEYQQLREQRLWLNIDGKPALSGRFDVVSYTNELALVQDYKTGFHEPDAAVDNAQLKVLAVLVAINLPTVQEVIVQLVSGPYGITEARYSIAQLSAAYEEIVRTLRAINAASAPFSPSTEACKFCGAKLICQAVKDLVVKPLTKLQMSALPEGGERAAKLLDEVEIMASLLKEIKKFYAAKFEDPTYTIPGYAMVPGATVREVTDWDTARSRLSEFLPVQQLNSAADYRLGELEKSLGKALKLKAKEAKEKMNQILNGLVETKQNASSLKRVKGEPRLATLEHV